MTRPGELPRKRLTARGITRAAKPDFKPYTWRGIPGPVIGTPAQIRDPDLEEAGAGDET